MTVKNQGGASLSRLVEIMRRLLAPAGCPWDREQSFATLKKYVVEEAYEVLDAIDGLGADASRPAGPAAALGATDPATLALREELGDLLLQVVFQAALAESRGWFGIDDVVAAIADKLERRHPHVFGEATVGSGAEVAANWEALKALEKQGRRTLAGMPRGLPALIYAFRVGEKAACAGFDWTDADGPRAKLDEELREFDAAVASGTADAVEHELGDVLLCAVNIARKRGLDPEEALRKANARFAGRFAHVEDLVKSSGRTMHEHSAEQLEALWQQAKRRDG